MAKQNYIQFSIPEPCHVPWNSMKPVDGIRRHCDSCEKVVIDFRSMTDDELVAFFSKNQKNVCGRLSHQQLNRPLMPLPAKSEKTFWWKSLLLLPLLLFTKQGKSQYTQARNFTEGDSVALASDRSLAANEIPKPQDPVPSIDTAAKQILVTDFSNDSVNCFVLKPEYFFVQTDSIYFINIVETGGCVAIDVITQPEFRTSIWMIEEVCIYGDIITVPDPPVSQMQSSFPGITACIQQPGEEQMAREKLKQLPIWKKLFEQIEFLQNWLRIGKPEKEFKIEKPNCLHFLEEEEKEKPEVPQPATPSSDYSLGILPDNRRNLRN